MTENTLQRRLGLFLIFGHLTVIIVILLSPFFGAFVDDATELIGLVAPLFAVHTTATVKALMKHRVAANDRSKQVPGETIIVSFLFPACFITGLVTLVLAYALDWLPIAFGQVKGLVASLQTVFGVYVGYIASALFAEEKEKA